MDKNTYLMHYGVKGMKWGVRKSRFPTGGRKKSSSARTSTNKRVKQSGKSRKPRSMMTDEELNARIERLEREKKLKNLQHDNQTEARKFVSDVMEKSAKNIATQAATYAMGSALNWAASKLLNNAPKDGIVNPKKGQKDK